MTITIFACSPCYRGKHKDCDPAKPCGCLVCYELVRITRPVIPIPRTQEQKIAFRKAWDARVDAAKQ